MSGTKKLASAKVSNKEATKIALAMALAVIFVPTLLALGNNVDDIGGFFAKKLLVGVFSFPILFLIAKYVFKPKAEVALSEESKGSLDSKPLSKWNYVGIIVGPLMLAFVFLPDFLAGKTGVNYLLGVIFWIVVIFFSARNILRSKRG